MDQSYNIVVFCYENMKYNKKWTCVTIAKKFLIIQ